MLFQRFDRLLFLLRGGQTAYFGEVGDRSKILVDYFTRNGGKECPPNANPAEWMLEVIGAAPGTHTDIDWHKTWLESPERQAVKQELRRLQENGSNKRSLVDEDGSGARKLAPKTEFAASFSLQLR
jgi:hypothetical protein